MERLSSVKRDLATYAAVLLVAGFLFVHALGIRTYSGTYLGPALWPEIILGLTIITCILSLAGRIYRLWKLTHGEMDLVGKTSRQPTESHELHASPTNAIAAPSAWNPLIAVALTGAYIYLLPRMGYLLDTALYVTAFIYFGNFRKLLVAALLGTSASLVFMIIFMRLVYISLPVGNGPFEHVSTFVMRALGIH